MLALALEIAIKVAMGNHLYSFNGSVRLQLEGGPIGNQLSGALAKVYMLYRCRTFLRLAQVPPRRRGRRHRAPHTDRNLRLPASHQRRGLGATPSAPAVSCAEENLLEHPNDPYFEECICIHEFAHAIHQMGMKTNYYVTCRH